MKYSESLKKNQDFQKVYKLGTSNANRYLVMYVLRNGYDKNRLGISVSKKIGNSVVRHRITRLIRESYRLNEESYERGLDIVVIARKPVSDKGFDIVSKSMSDLSHRHRIAGEINEKNHD